MKKTRIVVDIPLHIKRMIYRVQHEAQETMLAFTDALRLLEMAEDPQYAALLQAEPLSPEEMQRLASMLLEHWQRFMESIQDLQQRARCWAEDADELPHAPPAPILAESFDKEFLTD
jgi:hypothetical protein